MMDCKTIAVTLYCFRQVCAVLGGARGWRVGVSVKARLKKFVQDLQNQGYEFLSSVKSPAKFLENARVQLQNLNSVQFSDSEETIL